MIFSMGRWSSERNEFGAGPHMIGHARAGQPTFHSETAQPEQEQEMAKASRSGGERRGRCLSRSERLFFFADGAVLEHVGEDFQKTG
jgi:hypothetical protein